MTHGDQLIERHAQFCNIALFFFPVMPLNSSYFFSIIYSLVCTHTLFKAYFLFEKINLEHSRERSALVHTNSSRQTGRITRCNTQTGDFIAFPFSCMDTGHPNPKPKAKLNI